MGSAAVTSSIMNFSLLKWYELIVRINAHNNNYNNIAMTLTFYVYKESPQGAASGMSRCHFLGDFSCLSCQVWFHFRLTQSPSLDNIWSMDYEIISPLVNVRRRLYYTHLIAFRSEFSKTGDSMSNRYNVHTDLNQQNYKTFKISVYLYHSLLSDFAYLP